MVIAVLVFVLLLAVLALAAGAFDRTPLRRTRQVIVQEPVREVLVERPVREVVTERRIVTERDPLL